MNLLSFLLMLVLWGTASGSILLLLRNNEEFAQRKKYFFLLALVLFALFLPIYAKLAVSQEFVFASSDEDIFIQNFNEFLNIKDISLLLHASGPGTIIFFYALKLLSNLTLRDMMLFVGIINSILTAVLVYLLFKRISKSFRLSFGGAFCALSSSYFMWPIIEVRPQQFGFPLLLLCIIFMLNYFQKGERKYLLFSSLLVIATAMIHVLTFLYLLPVIFALSLYYFAKSGEERITSKKFIAPLVAWIAGAVLINSFFYLFYDIQWTLRQTTLAHFHPIFSEMIELPFNITIFFPMLVLFFLIIGALFLSEAALVKWKKIAQKIREIGWILLQKHFQKTGFVFLAASIILLAIYVFSDLPHVFIWYGSFWKFFLLESGNILIGLFGVLGLLLALKDTKEKILRLPASILLVFALAFTFTLIAGFFMVPGYSNFSMRTLNYAVIFLGFFAFIALSWLYKIKKWRSIIFLLLLLFPCSLIVGTRDPSILNIKVTYHTTQNFEELQEIEEWSQREKISHFNSYRIKDSFEGMNLNQNIDIIFWGKTRFVRKVNE